MLWRLSSKRSRAVAHVAARHLSTAQTGFAGIPGLLHPSDWASLANDAEHKCRALAQDVVSNPPSIATIRLLDDISDTLCQVIDAAEFCRNVHQDPAWRSAATAICTSLGAFVHDLNTNYALYTALKASLPAADARKPVPNIGTGAWESGRRVEGRSGSNGAFDEESLLVGRMLLRDFERYGVHLNGSTRDRMSDLVARTQALGFTFVQNTIDPGKCGEVVLQGTAARSLQTLPPQLQRAFRPRQASGTATRMHGGVSALAARGTGPVLNSLLWHADNETVRKAAYRVYNTHPVDNVAVLDQLVTARHEMAALMGFPSYAHYQLDQFSLAGVPGAVQEFLNTLGTAIWPSCEAEAQALTAVKQRYSTRDADASARGQLKPWDWHWAVGRANAEDSTGTHVSALGQYLTLDGCVAALSTLLEGLMGVRLREERPASGEVWAPEVRRLVAEHAEEGPLGVVYLDLYRREGKFPGAAHFTLRCGRRLDDGAYQTPVVALVANMTQGGGFSQPELETLMHEFGHALNSLLSRTHYQHLSGTRGPQDVIELPSHVFERFATDPEALALFCHHSALTPGGSPTPPPTQLLHAVSASKRRFAALGLQGTLQLALIDQLLHGEAPPVGSQVERSIAELMQESSVMGYEPGTFPHLRFQHIVGYGANYYCYLFAQSLSAALWQRGQASPSGHGTWPDGDLLRRQLLEPGGAKGAFHYVSDVFGGRGEGVLNEADGGGWYPDVDGLLEHLHLR